MRLNAAGQAGWDVLDASKLTPPTGAYALVAPVALRDGQATRLAVDALGREVAVLHDGEAAGAVALTVDGRALAPGVYVVRAVGAEASLVRRLTVTR